MKNINIKVAAVACIVIFGMSYCKNSPSRQAENVEKAQVKLDTAEGKSQKAILDSTNEYDRYKMESESKLKENDLKIAQLKTKLKADKVEIRAKYEKQLAELELKNSKLKTQNKHWRLYRNGQKQMGKVQNQF